MLRRLRVGGNLLEGPSKVTVGFNTRFEPADRSPRRPETHVAFPPNYNQERNNRARAKAQKALDKQVERDEKSAPTTMCSNRSSRRS